MQIELFCSDILIVILYSIDKAVHCSPAHALSVGRLGQQRLEEAMTSECAKPAKKRERRSAPN